MADGTDGDLGARVYLELINTASTTLSHDFDPCIALQYLSEAKVEFAREHPQAGFEVSSDGVVSLAAPTAATRGFLARILFGLTGAYEVNVGVDEVWNLLWTKFKAVYEHDVMRIKEANLEFPLLKHRLDYLISHNLFGFSLSAIRKKDWVTGYPLVTTRNIIFMVDESTLAEGKTREKVVVPLHKVLTLGREVYIGYEKRSFYGNAWVIDYKDDMSNSSCAVLFGPSQHIQHYSTVVAFARRELKALTHTERKVLSLVSEHASSDHIEGELGISENKLKNIVYRLRQLNIISEKNEVTAYGLTVLAETPGV